MSDRPTRQEISAIDALAEAEEEAYLIRSSVKFLECAIHLCASHMSIKDVITLLEAETDMLRELG